MHPRRITHIIPRIRLRFALQPQRNVQGKPIRARLKIRRAGREIVPAEDKRRVDVDDVERRFLACDPGFGAVQSGDFGGYVGDSDVCEWGCDFGEAVGGVVGGAV